MAQQAAEDPMHQIQWFIMAKSSFSRCIDGGFGLCPNYLGLYYTPGPIVSPMVGSMSPTDAPNLQCSLLKIFGFDAQINVLAG